MPSSRLIVCRPLFLLPPTPPSIRVFSNESTLPMRWPKCWSFSFSIIPSKEIPGMISFRWTGWISLQSKPMQNTIAVSRGEQGPQRLMLFPSLGTQRGLAAWTSFCSPGEPSCCLCSYCPLSWNALPHDCVADSNLTLAVLRGDLPDRLKQTPVRHHLPQSPVYCLHCTYSEMMLMIFFYCGKTAHNL